MTDSTKKTPGKDVGDVSAAEDPIAASAEVAEETVTTPVAPAAPVEVEEPGPTLAAPPVDAGLYQDPVAKLAEATGIADPDALRAIIQMATAELTQAHKAEINALRSEVETMKSQQDGMRGGLRDNNESLGGFPWMYYRLPQTWPDAQRRGWIVIGPGGASPRSGQRDTGSFANYLRKGMIPITKYGLCPVPTSTNVADHFVLFVQNGGAQEFPPSQVVAYAWHKRNPFAKLGVRFTQVDPIRDSLKSFTCDFCGYSLDFMPDDPSAGTAYRQHLMNADKIPFREAIESVKAAGLSVTPFRPRDIDQIMELATPNG